MFANPILINTLVKYLSGEVRERGQAFYVSVGSLRLEAPDIHGRQLYGG
jgi:hypothetical protein